ncbi:hypothetical protein A0H81_03907 [Grifola frondosa]|uniref:Uncharacterized protein n=1 Tax=Grifola frondosa TaxID=5627 RepID=A0A1C7MME1_GRIFR|nr:hypothetical protein A0H81_03907 [Grifola frondosa]
MTEFTIKSSPPLTKIFLPPSKQHTNLAPQYIYLPTMSAQSTLGLTGISEVAMDVDQTISGNKDPSADELEPGCRDGGESSVPALAGTTVPVMRWDMAPLPTPAPPTQTNASNPVMQWPRLSPPANTNPLPTIPRPVTMNWQLDSPQLGEPHCRHLVRPWQQPYHHGSSFPPSIGEHRPPNPLFCRQSALRHLFFTSCLASCDIAVSNGMVFWHAAERYRQYMETLSQTSSPIAVNRQYLPLPARRRQHPGKTWDWYLPGNGPSVVCTQGPADVEEDDEVLLSLREEALQWMRRDAMRTFGWQEELHRLRFLIRTRAGGLTMDAVDNEVAAKPKTANDLISWETIAKERRRYERSLKRWNLPSQPYPVPETGNASSSGS